MKNNESSHGKRKKAGKTQYVKVQGYIHTKHCFLFLCSRLVFLKPPQIFFISQPQKVVFYRFSLFSALKVISSCALKYTTKLYTITSHYHKKVSNKYLVKIFIRQIKTEFEKPRKKALSLYISPVHQTSILSAVVVSFQDLRGLGR